ncbi:amino acid ABC transporter permease [Amycolatopsis ultiminotia]|uniref:Amino acid ABC transporter permease n=1 Tax=Amycolatopsis ultiminotia TaxID=543629 RepID=A0ABP6WGX1_9PSEU
MNAEPPEPLRTPATATIPRDPTGPPAGEGQDIKAVPLRHPLRWLAALVIVVLIAMAVHLLVTNPNWQWDVVGQYLFSSPVVDGVKRTLLLTVLAEIVGIVFGVVLAIMRLSPNPVLSWTSRVYTWTLRGIPPLVLLLFIYFLSALLPTLSLGIPFGPSFVEASTNKLITQQVAAVAGLGLAQAAYVSEIVRGGILSIPPGQTRAALAMGMKPRQVMWRIVLPQAMRVVVPPLGNEVISMFKATSLTSVIAYSELLTTVQVIYARTFEQIPMLVVACLWYGVLTTVATIVQSLIERRLGRSLKTPKGDR